MNLFAILTVVEPSEPATPPSLKIEDLITYIILLAIIFVAIILIAIVKKAIRNEANPKKIITKLDKCKKYTEKIITKTNKKDLLIAPAKLRKLTSLIANATWIASRSQEENKDVILDEITSLTDSLATYIGDYSEEAFYEKEEYVSKLEYTLKAIEVIRKKTIKFLNETK